MALLRDMKTVIINVHLGGAPSFDIRADESATATPAECRWSAHEAGPGARDFLVELIEKVKLAYASTPSAPLCTDGPKIRPQAECRL
jgi:hypothetical protein